MSSRSKKGPTKQIFMPGRRGAMGSFKEAPLRSKDILWRRLRKMMLTPSDEQAIRRARKRMMLVVGMVVVPIVVVGMLVLVVLR